MSYTYSLIIPHYNIPYLLKRLLDTIPKRDDLQVIVVDDCSTKHIDQLYQLKKEYDFVEWYSTGTNGGGGKARNIGLEHAVGKYVLFADSDDILMAECDKLWDKAIEEDIHISYFLVNVKNEDGSINNCNPIKYKHEKYKKSPDRLNNWLRYGYPEPWGKLIKRDLLTDYSITFQETRAANDMLFSVKTGYYAEKIQFINIPFYSYYHRENSVSYNQLGNDLKILERLKAYYQVQEFLLDKGIRMTPFSRFILFLLKNRNLRIVKQFCKDNKINFYSAISKSCIHRIMNYPFMY